MPKEPTIKEIQGAHQRITPYINHTPLLTSHTFNRMCTAELFFKCENFQKTGSFKMRGASNAVFSLPTAQAKHGVTTHSSGNHAAALSLAARKRGIACHVVMPGTSPRIKVNAVKNYGGQITFCPPTQKDRERELEKVRRQTGARFIHPYNNYRVIAGQATAALECLQEIPDPDYIIAPVGGGGLLSGTALTTRSLAPQTKILGAEPRGADDAYRSLKYNKIIPSVNPQTIADGLLTSLGSRTFPIITRLVSAILTVPDDQIIRALRLIWERMKIMVEPSSAVSLAALLSYPTRFTGKRVILILSGGNVDMDNLPW